MTFTYLFSRKTQKLIFKKGDLVESNSLYMHVASTEVPIPLVHDLNTKRREKNESSSPIYSKINPWK